MSGHPYQELHQAFATQRRESGARHRDIAQKLGISEAELIAAHVDAEHALLQAIGLRAQWPELIAALQALGEVMALTRNESAVHEKTGVYRNCSHSGKIGLVLGGEIDLRLFYSQWAHGFAVIEQTAQGVQRSLQFFDAKGVAIHKVFLRPASDVVAYQALVAQFAAAEQRPGIVLAAASSTEVNTSSAASANFPAATLGNAAIIPSAMAETGNEPGHGSIMSASRVAEFRRAWAALRDTHDFFALLKQFSLSRTHALRLAEAQFVHRLDPGSCQQLLHAAASAAVPIMVFVSNPGMVQIHSGPVRQVVVRGPWLNVLDPGFNLHLREDHIAEAWVVRKPTQDGLVTSLELFDANGDTIAMFFGERKPGKPELCQWRALIDNLIAELEPCPA